MESLTKQKGSLIRKCFQPLWNGCYEVRNRRETSIGSKQKTANLKADRFI